MRNEEKSKPCCKEQGRKQEFQSWDPRKKGNSSRRTLLLLKGSDGSQSRESKKPSRKWQLGLRKPNGAVRSLTAWQQKMGSSELHRSQKLKWPRSLWERKQVKWVQPALRNLTQCFGEHAEKIDSKKDEVSGAISTPTQWSWSHFSSSKLSRPWHKQAQNIRREECVPTWT